MNISHASSIRQLKDELCSDEKAKILILHYLRKVEIEFFQLSQSKLDFF